MKLTRLLIVLLPAMAAIMAFDIHASISRCRADDASADRQIQSITAAELEQHLSYLASDELKGRKSGTHGYDQAADYCISQFRACGLSPLPQSGDYFQEFRFSEFDLSPGCSIAIRGDNGSGLLQVTRDFYVFRPGPGESKNLAGELVWLGYGISEPDYGHDDLAGKDIAGKIAIIRLGTPSKGDQPLFPEQLDMFYRGAGGLFPKVNTLIERGASAVLAVVGPGWARDWTFVGNTILWAVATIPEEEAHGFWPLNSPVPVIFLHPDALARILPPGDHENPFTLLDGARADIQLDATEQTHSTRNVIGILPGSDPDLRDEYVVVTAHLDHLGIRNGQIMNGADDDASGCVAILEAAEALALNPPRRSVVFTLFSMEEWAIVGSGYFMENPPIPLDKVVANVNLEMMGYYTADDPDSYATTATSDIAGSMTDLMKGVERESGCKVRYHNRFLIGGDNFSFFRKGIATTWLGTIGPRNGYHQPEDDVEFINMAGLETMTRVTMMLVRDIANADARPEAAEDSLYRVWRKVMR